MFFSNKLRVTLAAAVISTAAMACGGSPDHEPAPTVKQNGTTFSAKASAKSQAALQVTRWHSTIESGVNGAVVLDGQDRVGRVKYLQTAFIDKKTQTVHLQVILPEKGEIVWDLKRHVVLSNTVPASVQPYARGIYYDFQMAHPLRGGATQAYSYLSAGLKIAAGAAIATAGAFVDATILGAPVGAVLNYVGTRLIVAGVVDAIYTASGDKIAKDEAPAAPSSNAPASGDDPAVAAKDAVDQANPGASPPDAPAAPAADPAAPATDPAAPATDPAAPATDPAAPATDPAAPATDPAAPATDPAAPAADPATPGTPVADNGTPTNDASGTAADGAALPTETTGGNLDNVDPGTTATNDTGNGGAATDTGGGDTGGDSSGGAEAAGLCRKVAISATTKIRACVHY